MRIAVVGSGIAGLSAARLLSRDHEVTVFEKSARLGMDAHSLDVNYPDGAARVDVPLRVFFDGFYPNLTTLYRELDIDFKPINYAASFGYLNERTFFRFDNYRFGSYAIPFLKGLSSFRGKALRIGWDIVRFFRKMPKSLAAGISDSTTLEDYLRQHNYSDVFAYGFLYPAFAGICTCSHASIKRYPARVILEYLNSGILLSSVQRVTHGTQEVVQLLARDVQTIKLDAAVTEVTSTPDGVKVQTTDQRFTFDHVVLATQANQTARLLDRASAEERKALVAFDYEPSRVVVHRDTTLAPAGGEAAWAPVNFVLPDDRATPMATIWMNAIQAMPGLGPVFQTWNPLIEPAPGTVLGEATFERPVVTTRSLQALNELRRLHAQPGRRVWFCGSYAAHGIPLLESATKSAMAVAENVSRI
ncbi:MAG: FAD-dependent oxidoreductase [Pseudomonadota bacterium]